MKALPIIGLMCVSTLWSGETLELRTHSGRTLPAEVYSLLKKGNGRGSFSWSWKDKDFSPGEGYAVEETRWNHDERNGRLLAYLRDQLDLEARASSPNRLTVKVVYYAVNSAGPQLILEGTVTAKGKATAYFVESAILDPGDSVRGLVDEFMEDFTAFMK